MVKHIVKDNIVWYNLSISDDLYVFVPEWLMPERGIYMTDYVNIVLIWNIIVMLLYGTDKMLAKAHRRRISEVSLLICSFLMEDTEQIHCIWIMQL